MSHRWYIALELVLIAFSVVVKFVFDDVLIAVSILVAAWVTFMLGEHRRMSGVTLVNRQYHGKLQHVLGNMKCSDEEARQNLSELKCLE